MKALYTATATAVGGREGHIKSSDGVLEAKLAVPKELGGPGGPATNPEQLFAAGYAACFEGAVRHVARGRKKVITQSSVTAKVGIGPHENGEGFGIKVDLEVSLPGMDRAEAQDIVNYAHEKICPYSHATRGNVEVNIKLV